MEMALIIGAVTFLNIMILKVKYDRQLWYSFSYDLGGIIVLNMFFGGTLAGATIAMVASLLWSFWLLLFPPERKPEPDYLSEL